MHSARHWYMSRICELSTVTNDVRTLYTDRQQSSYTSKGLPVLFELSPLFLLCSFCNCFDCSNLICLPIIIAHKLKSKINFVPVFFSFSGRKIKRRNIYNQINVICGGYVHVLYEWLNLTYKFLELNSKFDVRIIKLRNIKSLLMRPVHKIIKYHSYLVTFFCRKIWIEKKSITCVWHLPKSVSTIPN